MGVRTEKPYVVFYQYSKISPVSQNISDLRNTTTEGDSFSTFGYYCLICKR